METGFSCGNQRHRGASGRSDQEIMMGLINNFILFLILSYACLCMFYTFISMYKGVYVYMYVRYPTSTA